MSAENIKFKKEESRGFVAGTLIHTDKGLVPIDQLKVGDMVLSKHESGVGETAYKRVVSTFKSEEKQKIMSPLEGVYCTDNHPFWVLGKGWVAANQLDGDTDQIYWLQSNCDYVYNIEVEDYHTYFVTKYGYLARDVKY